MSIINDLLAVVQDTVKQDNLDRVQRFTEDKFGTVDQYLQRTETRTEPDYARGFVAGLIGGLVGVGVKIVVDRMLPTDQPKEETEARFDVIEEAEKLTGIDLTDGQEDIAQQVLNVGVGAVIGGVYGVIAEAAPSVQAPGGVPFGAGLWTASHKVALPLLGLAPAALQDRASRQLGQLAGHVAYGATVEIVRRGVRHLMDGEEV